LSNLLLLSILLCLIVGSAIDTSNICVVRAASDLTAGKPAMAVSVLFASACAAIVFFLNTRLGLLRQPPPWSYPTFITFAGAILFATGALVNGACAIGTIGRLARGDIGYIATVAGALAVAFFIPRTMIENQTPDLPALTGSTWLGIILAFSAVLMIICRHNLRARRLGSYAVLGVAAAVVTNWQGNWTWLSLIEEMRIGMPIQYAALACIAAVLLGAALTALAKGRFHFVRPDPRRMSREALGGGLMAAGSILIPGGNDALLVFGIPSGSPHAITGYAVMFTVMLLVLQVNPLHRRWVAWDGPGAAP
jgi:hypothetical protein